MCLLFQTAGSLQNCEAAQTAGQDTDCVLWASHDVYVRPTDPMTKVLAAGCKSSCDISRVRLFRKPTSCQVFRKER